MPEKAAKIARVRTYLKAHSLDAVAFLTRSNFAWITGGGDNHVVSQIEDGVAAVVVTARQVLVVTNKIEADRIAAEEPIGDFTLKVHPWTMPMDAAVAKILEGKVSAGDSPALGLPPLPGDFNDEVRSVLDEHEIRRYKALGRDCSLVIETVARNLSAGDSGHQVEADLARHLLARGIQPFVLLVSFDQRLQKYRHPVPCSNHVQHHAMLVVCGRKHGLIASLTRFVHFGRLPDELRARHEAACRVEAALWKATKPGTAYGEVLKAGIAQYKKEGFAKEWELHHQGGPTGYAGRDFLVTPDETRTVKLHQAVAWNPSITGAKTEDTFITGEKGHDVITACSSHWPTITARIEDYTVVRPDVLVR